MTLSTNEILKRTIILQSLERLCSGLDLSKSDIDKVQEQIDNISEHIKNYLQKNKDIIMDEEDKRNNDRPKFRSFVFPIDIYLQGSAALGTTVRPIGRNEFDIDIVSNFSTVYKTDSPNPPEGYTQILTWKRYFGDILKEYNGYSNAQIKEKNRCWRINPKGNYHFDITPTARDVGKRFSVEWIVDNDQKTCFETNPKGLKKKFEEIADKGPEPNIIYDAFRIMQFNKSVSVDIPFHKWGRGYLRRIIQLLKRHRDCYFENKSNKDYMPISMIITLLTMRAYGFHCRNQTPFYDSLDLISKMIGFMHQWYLKSEKVGKWEVLNPTNHEENFADKWSYSGIKKGYPDAFHEWIYQAYDDFNNPISTLNDVVIMKSLTK